MFSATFSQDIMNLVDRWTNDPVRVEVEPKVKTSDDVEQHVYLVSSEEKYPVLRRIVSQPEADRVMVYANRRDIVRDLAENLKKDGIPCQVLSGEVPQNKRIRTLDGFKEGKFEVLVATDVAGRGIHVDGVSHVINFTLPEDAEDYVHRIGRTGRAGKKGVSISFACEDDSFQIPAIEEYIKSKIKLEQLPAEFFSDEASKDAAEKSKIAIAEKLAKEQEAESAAAEVVEEAPEKTEDVVVVKEDSAEVVNETIVEEPVGEITQVIVEESENGPEIAVEVSVEEDIDVDKTEEDKSETKAAE